MESHVKVLGALHIAFGAFGVLLAFALMLIVGGVVGMAGASGDPDAALAIPIVGFTGMAVLTFMLVLSLPGIIIGLGLVRFRHWARIAGLVLSLVDLFLFPFGTVLGAYGLWVLFSRDAERLLIVGRQPEAA